MSRFWPPIIGRPGAMGTPEPVVVQSGQAAIQTAPPSPADTGAAFYSRLDSPKIPSLNGIRAIAAFSVAGFHAGVSPWCPGRLGVLAFFVLSGFLITWLLLKELADHGTISLRGFYYRRTLRIFPAFYAFWILQVLILPVIPWKLVLSCAAYVSNYYIGLAVGNEPSVMSHTWSLAVEEQFYLLWPVLFYWQRHRLNRLAWILGGWIVAVQLLRAAMWIGGVNHSYVGYAFETRSDALAVGCLMALVLASRPKIPTWLMNAYPVTLLAIAGGIYLDAVNSAASLVYGFGPVAFAVAILIAQGIYRPFWILNNPVMDYLGKISYPVYLYHMLVLGLVHALPIGHALKGAIGILLLVVVATGSFYLVERPFQKLKGRR
jgi:peptidoglycan/LPS O-acetylase OafA/YrhL